MALANFIDRAATAASQVLRGFDFNAFRSTLEAHAVGIAFDSAASSTPEGQVTLELTVNLLARLYPSLAIVPLGRGSKAYVPVLEELAKAINPDVLLARRVKPISPCVVVGGTAFREGSRQVYVGSDGWIARLSAHGPVGSGITRNPFGAAAAACFGAANIFRIIFAAQLPHGEVDESINLSLLDYRQDVARQANAPLPEVQLHDTALVGVGAIGNGFIWVLSRLPQLTGTIDLVDHEPVELSNLQRYVLTAQNHVSELKVDIAAKLLQRPGFEPRAHRKTWAAFVKERPAFDVDCAAVALDSAKDRIAVQGALPRRIFNAWTQSDDLGISRHQFLGADACLACLYLPDRKQPDEDEIVANAMGLPAARREIRQLLSQNAPVGRDLLARISTALSLPMDPLLAFEGHSIRDFYTRAFCGGVIFRTSTGSRPAQAIVPMTFQSALAGVMLAAEVVANAAGLKEAPPPVTTTINLLRPLAPYLCFGRKKDRESRCICQDEDYISAYVQKWGSADPGVAGAAQLPLAS